MILYRTTHMHKKWVYLDFFLEKLSFFCPQSKYFDDEKFICKLSIADEWNVEDAILTRVNGNSMNIDNKNKELVQEVDFWFHAQFRCKFCDLSSKSSHADDRLSWHCLRLAQRSSWILWKFGKIFRSMKIFTHDVDNLWQFSCTFSHNLRHFRAKCHSLRCDRVIYKQINTSFIRSSAKYYKIRNFFWKSTWRRTLFSHTTFFRTKIDEIVDVTVRFDDNAVRWWVGQRACHKSTIIIHKNAEKMRKFCNTVNYLHPNTPLNEWT
jgi:hypothetical protein